MMPLHPHVAPLYCYTFVGGTGTQRISWGFQRSVSHWWCNVGDFNLLFCFVILLSPLISFTLYSHWALAAIDGVVGRKLHHTSLNHIFWRSDSYSLTQSKELKHTGLWLSCHRDVKYSTAPLTIARRQFLWTCTIFELLCQNKFYSTIVCTTEQENVSLYVVL